MAYNPYTDDQIRSFFSGKGSAGSDPWALKSYSSQYNADPEQVARVQLGATPQQTQQWLAGAQQQLSGPIADTRGLADRNPYMAHNLAQQRGYTPGQAATLYGKSEGDIGGWLGSTGLSLGGGATASPAGGNPYLQIGGTPTQAANSPASPYTGALVSPESGPTGNPYTPAGGPGSNGRNDPRMGMPSTGNQNFSGLSSYLWDNPSTLAMGNEVTRGVMNALQRQALPAIRGNAMAAGTVGGSRQGVAEGLATGDAMSGLAGALANLYGNQYNQDRGYGLQSDALDFNIHRGNLQDMRTGQQDQIGFLDQMARWGQQGVGVANQTRDRQFSDWQRFVSPAAQIGGMGGTQSQNQQGNPYLGAIGGYLAGSRGFGG
jgi:hypothetical protein